VHLLVSEQYTDTIMHGATIKIVLYIHVPNFFLNFKPKSFLERLVLFLPKICTFALQSFLDYSC